VKDALRHSSVILVGQKGRIGGQPPALRGELPVEARLVLRAQRIGVGGGLGIAGASWARPSQYPARPMEIGLKTVSRKASKWPERGVVAAEAEGAIPRKPFQFGKGEVIVLPVSEVVGGIVVAGVELPLAHHVAGKIGAPVGPCHGTPSASAEVERSAISSPALSQNPDLMRQMKRSKARPGIVAQRRAPPRSGRRRRTPGAQAKARLGQRMPASGTSGNMARARSSAPFPEQVIEAPDVQIVLVQKRLVAGPQCAAGRIARHGQAGPRVDDDRRAASPSPRAICALASASAPGPVRARLVPEIGDHAVRVAPSAARVRPAP
jgi:hypothetical protein